jgi:peroxiredoxin Q/BCP
MIEPPKASKGRRMSKKSRKKSPKPTSKAKSSAKPAAAKKRASKTRRATVGKTRKAAPSRPSHKAASKMLKSSDAARPKARMGSAVDKSPALLEGAKAPDFRLPRDGGDSVALSDFSGKKLVLFFYPRADTPGCTREAIDFTRLASDFAASGTAVLGVSADSQKAQESFRDKHKLSVPLMSDETHQMLEAYGAWGEKSMYGRTFLGIIRTTILVGTDGRVARLWRHVKVDGHADQVLEAARSL